MAAKKKSFTDDLTPITNPAMQYISTTEAITAPDVDGEQTRFVFNAPDKEKKDRRVQLLLKPSVYDKLRAAAEREGASLNAYINAILEYHIGGGDR